MDQSFSKDYRLLTKSDFKNLKGSSIKHVEGLVVSFSAPNTKGLPRLGIAIGKKFGNAVSRNKFKRISREIFRRNRNFIPSIDVLITVSQRNFISLNNQSEEDVFKIFKSDLLKTLNHISKS